MFAWICLPVAIFAVSQPGTAADTARRVLETAGVQGGLIVHVGCSDGRLTAALCASDAYLVHGLDPDPENVARARESIRTQGLAGRVSVMQWNEDGLPYADNLANLLVVSSVESQVSEAEMRRVLCPGGVMLSLQPSASSLEPYRKPWPDDIDEWTHWLHGPDGNAVARDRLVGPPRKLQWMAPPLWARLHDAPSTTSAMVSAGGRVFYIGDEGPTGMYDRVADKWFLTARDAFNGTLLWKRPMPEWGWQQWTADWHARNNQPFQLPKRLVAMGDQVYVTLGFHAPLTALDAATGEIVKTYEGTEGTDEILVTGDLLVLSLNQQVHRPTEARGEPLKKRIAAIAAGSGEVLWKTGEYVGLAAKTDSIEPVGRLELAVGGGRVHFCDGQAIAALDLKSGQEIWRVERPGGPRQPANFKTRMGELCVLLYNDGVVLFLQPEGTISFHSVPGTMYAYDAANGNLLWQQRYGGWVHNTQPNVFVIDGVVWVHEHIEGDQPAGNRMVFSAAAQAAADYAVLGLDLHTGRQLQRLSTREIFNVGHHHRCYRNKATERYLLTSRRGVEFIDTTSGGNDLNHWLRGDCQLGVMPCNGLLYTTPHPCSCYIDTKLNGYYCLAAAGEGESGSGEELKSGRVEELESERVEEWKGGRVEELESERVEELKSVGFERGPAFGTVQSRTSEGRKSEDWPMFRANSMRGGAVQTAVPEELSVCWQADVGGRIGPLSIADGLILTPVVDEHRMVALEEKTGRLVWEYTAGGRVDTPPTLHQGLALFGSADGWVYCVRAVDGQLVWRRRVADAERLVGAAGQLESAWPVHGSVLVQTGVAYVAAGRSSYLDGGITLCALDPHTGEAIERQGMNSLDAETNRMPPGDASYIPGALADILVGDGEVVWMRRQRVFGPEDDRRMKPVYATGGFRDDSWFNRTTWAVGDVPHAQLLVFDPQNAYGIEAYASTSRAAPFRPGDKGYHLFAQPLTSKAEPVGGNRRGEGIAKKKKDTANAAVWSQRIPVRATAMALAGDTLLLAGAPDIIDSDDPLGPLEGRHGGRLCLYQATTGNPLSELRLDALPVWDGLAVANQRVYLATQSGMIICLGSR